MAVHDADWRRAAPQPVLGTAVAEDFSLARLTSSSFFFFRFFFYLLDLPSLPGFSTLGKPTREPRPPSSTLPADGGGRCGSPYGLSFVKHKSTTCRAAAGADVVHVHGCGGGEQRLLQAGAAPGRGAKVKAGRSHRPGGCQEEPVQHGGCLPHHDGRQPPALCRRRRRERLPPPRPSQPSRRLMGPRRPHRSGRPDGGRRRGRRRRPRRGRSRAVPRCSRSWPAHVTVGWLRQRRAGPSLWCVPPPRAIHYSPVCPVRP